MPRSCRRGRFHSWLIFRRHDFRSMTTEGGRAQRHVEQDGDRVIGGKVSRAFAWGELYVREIDNALMGPSPGPCALRISVRELDATCCRKIEKLGQLSRIKPDAVFS